MSATVLAPVLADTSQTPLVKVTAALMQSRQTILPKRLMAPGPDASQFDLILNVAASAPDHGQLLPWRFVIVPQSARGALAEAFGAALLARDAGATLDQVAQAQEKAYRSPLLMLLVVDGGGKGEGAGEGERSEADIDLAERIVSAGCAVQNMLLMATALGYGSALTSGKALKDDGLRRLFDLGAAEQALCFVSLGTVQSRKPHRLRPLPADFVGSLLPGGGVAAGWPPADGIVF